MKQALGLPVFCIHDIRLATHHLPHYFIAKESDAKHIAELAREHISYLENDKDKKFHTSDQRDEEQLLVDRIIFKDDGCPLM